VTCSQLKLSFSPVVQYHPFILLAVVFSQRQYSSSHRREERLAAQIVKSKGMRQEGYTRGREEFLASTITSAVGGMSGMGSQAPRIQV